MRLEERHDATAKRLWIGIEHIVRRVRDVEPCDVREQPFQPIRHTTEDNVTLLARYQQCGHMDLSHIFRGNRWKACSDLGLQWTNVFETLLESRLECRWWHLGQGCCPKIARHKESQALFVVPTLECFHGRHHCRRAEFHESSRDTRMTDKQSQYLGWFRRNVDAQKRKCGRFRQHE